MKDTRVHSWAWREGALAAQDFDLRRLPELRADCVVWVDIAGTDPAVLDPIAGELNLEPNAIEDAFSAHERPKLDRLPDHLFLNCYAVAFDAQSLQLAETEISVFLAGNVLITVHRDPDCEPVQLASRRGALPDLLRFGVAGLLHPLLDVIVDGYLDTAQGLDDCMDVLEDQLFDETSHSRQVQRDIYTLRRSLARLRRIVLPMREVLDALLRRDYRIVPDELRPYYDDVRDHVLRSSEWTDSLREMITTAFETSLSLQDSRLNNVMKKLTAWAAIIAVPTAVTGWYGQNVPYPGDGRAWGFWTSTIVIALAAVALYASFRKRGWL